MKIIIWILNFSSINYIN